MCKFCEPKDSEGRCEGVRLEPKKNLPESTFFDGCSMLGIFLRISNKGKEGSFLGNEIPYFDEEHDLKGFCEASIKIDYCPFCGKSLKGDTDNG